MDKQISVLRGTRDLLPEELSLWQKIEAASMEVFRRYRCLELRTPVIEASELFNRGIGEATDVVSKEMYTFTDRGERLISLRPEGTAGIVRSYIQNKLYTWPSPQKFWYFGPMFRYERPQAGRQRQFHQVGVEIFGTSAPKADAEAIAMAMDLFALFKVEGLEVLLNSLGCPECRKVYRQALSEYLLSHKEDFCPDCQTRMISNPLRVLDCKVPKCGELSHGAPSIQDALCDDCKDHQDQVERYLKALGIPFRRHARLVRGLDYYTRTVFEIVSGSLGAQNTLCGGGRYDNLVAECGGPETPAVGWSFGVERLAIILGSKMSLPGIDLFVACMGDAAEEAGFQIAHELRSHGFSVETSYGGGKLDKQIKQATRLEARYLLIIGDNELETGEFVLKDLANRTQRTLSRIGLVEALKA